MKRGLGRFKVYMENIVYILGAGFSEPLGLPLMGNFFNKSRDMVRREKERYGYFLDVIERINETLSIGPYFEYEAFNIEEALSILELSENLGKADNRRLHETLIKYIGDVISYYTPAIPDHIIANPGTDWYDFVFGKGRDDPFQWYGHFVASLFHLQLSKTSTQDASLRWIACEKEADAQHHYSVITLNYDLVLENICTFMNRSFRQESEVKFAENYYDLENVSESPYLVKIHGCAGKRNIIAPTYTKGLYQTELPVAWKFAYKLLMGANQIRIIGYSLPETDSYIKYLLKAAIGRAHQLEKIDVLCRDGDGKVKKRYDEFIKLKNYRFKSDETTSYIGYVHQLRTADSDKEKLKFDKLERAHDYIIGRQD